MNPCTWLAGGGGAGGGGSGKGGKGGKGDAGAGGDGTEGDPNDGNKGAGACGQGSAAGACTVHSAQASRGDPVDVVSGEMYTVPERDLYLPGPIALDFKRSYSSKHRERDIGIGFGWSHSLGWRFELKRRSVVVTNGAGASCVFPQLEVGEESLIKGWILRRDSLGYELDAADYFRHVFRPVDTEQQIYRLTEIRGSNQVRIELRYDAAGRLQEVIDSAGRSIRFVLDGQGRVSAIEVPDPITLTTLQFARFEYDARGRLIAATHADGETTRYHYDDSNLMSSYELPSGLVFRFLHDKEGRCVETWGEYASGLDPALAANLPTLLTDGQTPARGIFHCRFEYYDDFTHYYDSVRSQRFVFNADGEIEKAVGDSGVTTTTFDKYGNMASHTNPLGETRLFEFDERGRLLSETDALGRTFRIVRDEAGRVIENIDTAGGVARAQRDKFGNVVSITDQLGGTTLYTLDARGLITDIDYPNGGRARYVSDAHGNLAEMHLPNGAVWRWSYDFYGRPLKRTDPLGRETRYCYTQGGKITSIEDRLGRVVSFGYDAAGQMVWKRDAMERSTHYAFGGLRWPTGYKHPDGSELGWRYNREGWVVECINERGEVHRTEHDSNGNTKAERTFDGRQLRFGHDGLSRVSFREEKPGERELYEYSPVGELLVREYPDATQDAFEYNARNEKIFARSPDVEIAMERDATGQIVREVQTVLGEALWIESSFGLDGARTELRTSLGHVETYERDVMARPQSIRLSVQQAGARTPLAVVHIERDLFGYPLRLTLPRGAIVEDEYDTVNRLVRRTVVPPNTAKRPRIEEPEWVGRRRFPGALDKSYDYSAKDELVTAWDAARGATSYQYDDRGRLAERKREDQPAERYKQDPICNLYAGDDRIYGDGGRLLQHRSTRFAWDEQGRLSQRLERDASGGERLTRYEWNGRGLLSALHLPDGSKLDFLYDAFSRRLLKRSYAADGSLTSTTRFVWDGDRIIHEITETVGTESRRVATYAYDDGAFTPWAQRLSAGASLTEQGEWRFLLCDPNDTPEELIDGAGNVVSHFEHDSWGKRTALEGGETTPFAFQGQYIDTESGLHYNRARYYDPEIGRYISPDPVGLEGGSNPYVYCPNPVTWVDPFGLQYWPHTCTASLTDGDGNTMTPPNPVYRTPADAAAGNSAGNGFYSGYASNGRNNCWPGRTEGTNTPDQWRNQFANGNMGTGRQQCHTEQKAMRWADQMALPPSQGQNAQLAGGTMRLGGQLPPCTTCNASMREWSASRKCSIVYSHPVNQGVTYHGNGNPPTHHPPW